jgi:hypothetical protein
MESQKRKQGKMSQEEATLQRRDGKELREWLPLPTNLQRALVRKGMKVAISFDARLESELGTSKPHLPTLDLNVLQPSLPAQLFATDDPSVSCSTFHQRRINTLSTLCLARHGTAQQSR